MAERKEWWEILRDQLASRGLLDPESERVQEAVQAAPAVQRQARGLLSLDPQAESDAVLEMGLGSMPGVGQVMALRDLERARRAKDPGAAAMAASNFIPFGTLLNRFRRGPMSELDVYHGTPHRFPGTEENPLGEFDASKIGTGEGAQVFGHGIYYAENPDVARIYSADRAYVGAAMQGKPQAIDYDSPEWTAQQTIDEFGDSKKALAHLQMVQRTASKYQSPETKAGLQGAIDLITSGGVKPKGSLYKADLPDDMIDRMLDYDKPLSEQTPLVRNALKKLGIEHGSAQDVVTHLGSKNSQKYLTDVGIPGIKYQDAGSRGQGGSGTRNFVVFPGEEKKVKILEPK